jgi:hypothetical protein
LGVQAATNSPGVQYDLLAGLVGHPRAVRQGERRIGLVIDRGGVAVEQVVRVNANARTLPCEPDVLLEREDTEK